MDQEPNSVSSPSTEEASACPDFISSYTQISNIHELGEHTDVESSDEFSEESNNAPGIESNLPKLSSQIIEWSQQRSQIYQNEIQTITSDEENKFNCDADNPKEKCYFIQKNILDNIESHAKMLSKNLNTIMNFICDSTAKVTFTSAKLIENYQTNLYETCEIVDSDIKLMYKIIAKCEELNKSMGFINVLATKIQEVKQTLEFFEKVVDKS